MQHVTRRWWLMASFGAPFTLGLSASALRVRLDGDDLRVAAPEFRFLTGKPLERLKDGDSVAYLASLELLDESKTTPLRTARGRFVVSYALWEEQFSVTQLAAKPVTRNGLSAVGAEAWCFENLPLDTSGVSADRYLWLRFEIHTANARDVAAEGIPGVSFARIIQWLGRKNTEQTQWGPLERRVRLADLPRTPGRGSRG